MARSVCRPQRLCKRLVPRPAPRSRQRARRRHGLCFQPDRMAAKHSDNRGACVVVFALWGTLGACTTLGPTPAMTGIPSPPLERPGVELQVAAVPGYFLSSAATEEPKGS